MASTVQFTAWNENRTARHVIKTTTPLVRVTNHLLRPSEWIQSKYRIKKAYPTGTGPLTPAQRSWCKTQMQRCLTVPTHDGTKCYRCEVPSWQTKKSCGVACYRAWHRDHFSKWQHKFEIRQCEFGYGVFVRPGVLVPAGEPLGEYLGMLRPPDANPETTSAYTFGMTNGSIDSGVYGNWTRFVNSHCEPNVDALSTQVGKRMMILFQANRDLEPGEQLFISYGSAYFSNSKWGLCRCDVQPAPHVPPDGPGSDVDFEE